MSMSQRALLSLLFTCLISFPPSCSSARSHVLTFPIGQKAQVGKLIYQVIEAQWLPELEGAKQSPKNRILQLRLTVTNSGAEDAAIPFLRLIDAAGNEIVEVSDIEGNSHWLGALRRLQPSLTEEGSVYFDVPIGAYRLEIVDATEEKVAHIEIPASLAPPAATPGPTGN
ncbi:MAG: DUF4352 domain-containing protein [Bryobacteraceae bacterium]